MDLIIQHYNIEWYEMAVVRPLLCIIYVIWFDRLNMTIMLILTFMQVQSPSSYYDVLYCSHCRSVVRDVGCSALFLSCSFNNFKHTETKLYKRFIRTTTSVEYRVEISFDFKIFHNTPLAKLICSHANFGRNFFLPIFNFSVR